MLASLSLRRLVLTRTALPSSTTSSSSLLSFFSTEAPKDNSGEVQDIIADPSILNTPSEDGDVQDVISNSKSLPDSGAVLLPRSKSDTIRIAEFLKLPGLVVKNVPKSANSRDVVRFLKSKGPVEIDRVFSFRNDDFQPIGTWLAVTKSLEDARICLRGISRGEPRIGALKPELIPKKSVTDRFFDSYFFFDLYDASGRAVLLRGVDTFLSADFLRNQFRHYEINRMERNFIHIERENRNSPSSHYYLVKFRDESEAHRFIREKDNTKIFDFSDRPIRAEIIY